VTDTVMQQDTRQATAKDPRQLSSFGRIANIFMIVALTVGAVTIIGFMRAYPRFWYAGVIFLIIAVVGVLKRIAVLRGRLPANHIPPSDTDRPL
jgi:hypothetical protein